MRVGILTWYKELNHGAVLQAYSSMEIMKSINIVPCFIDYQRIVSNNLGIIKTYQKRVRRLINGDYILNKHYQLFNREKSQKFDVFRDKYFDSVSSDNDHYNCVMVGSDMVFSLVQGFSPFMFGIGIDTDYLFSYAACSGGTNIELVKKLGKELCVSQALESFRSIGCRDYETIKFVKALCPNKNTVETIDPVLLYGFDSERRSWNTGKWEHHKPYLLVYSYHGDINTKKEIEHIRRYAKEKRLSIVACGYYHPWCDECINCGPEEFVEMFANASAIITDTFHGTVFSIIFEKNFCAIVRGNAFKLEYLLHQCGLSNRIAKNVTLIPIILDTDIAYDECNKWLEKEREKSKSYIIDNLKNAKALL